MLAFRRLLTDRPAIASMRQFRDEDGETSADGYDAWQKRQRRSTASYAVPTRARAQQADRRRPPTRCAHYEVFLLYDGISTERAGEKNRGTFRPG